MGIILIYPLNKRVYPYLTCLLMGMHVYYARVWIWALEKGIQMAVIVVTIYLHPNFDFL